MGSCITLGARAQEPESTMPETGSAAAGSFVRSCLQELGFALGDIMSNKSWAVPLSSLQSPCENMPSIHDKTGNL